MSTLVVGLCPSSAKSFVPPQRQRNVIWRDPGDVRRLDLAWGPGGRAGAPTPPFTFLNEDDSGSNPKIEVRDSKGGIWGVKWGEEVNSEVFASRLVWAVGYFVEPSHFVRSGRILGVRKLDRAKKYVKSDGSFIDARFERREKDIQRLSDKESWRYSNNPFVGTKELNGLKIMIMLVSNWDSKDQEQAGRGSNTKILIVPTRAATEHRYIVSDWGGSMGKWGGILKREKWDCDGYLGQSNDFVKGVKNGEVQWGYSGQHTSDIKDGIPLTHVQWLMRYLGKLSNAQIHDALRASGASPDEEACFARAVSMRIAALWNLR